MSTNAAPINPRLSCALPADLIEAIGSVAHEIGRSDSAIADAAILRAMRLGMATRSDTRRDAEANHREELGLPPLRDDGLYHDKGHPHPPEAPAQPLTVKSFYLPRHSALAAMADHLDTARGPLLRTLLISLLRNETPAGVAEWVAESRR
jgi:hypothetical protein